MWRRNRGQLINRLAGVIEYDLCKRQTGLSKPHQRGLADLVASSLFCRSANINAIAILLPRGVKSDKEKYHYAYRWLSNPRISPAQVVLPFAMDILNALQLSNKEQIFFWIEERLHKGFKVCLLGVQTQQGIIPIRWEVCDKNQSMSVVQAVILQYISGILTKAMQPSVKGRLLSEDTLIWQQLKEYGCRWDTVATRENNGSIIEAIFQPLNQEGIGLLKTQLHTADRINKLLLVFTLSLYWLLASNLDLNKVNKLPKQKLRVRNICT